MVLPKAGKMAPQSAIDVGKAKISARAGLAIYIPCMRTGFEPQRGAPE